MTLLTDEIKALIGREMSYTAPEELGRASIRYFALAVGDDNPLYTDDAYARAHGYDGIVAPPTLICESNQYAGLPRNEDGFAGHVWHLDIPKTRLVRGGNAYEFHEPVRPTDVITATWRVEDVTEKAGKLFVISCATYVNQHGDLLAVNEETLIYVPLESL
ncbi:MaoC family dehydratase N-terminal domain-containing protein [Nonomuraea sp. NPDC059194]|uniref:FAS1-like dehydratase domain-containing protein n=1 Tax=Nonomuraea sp. NPDC059194 TaxID=3346764 RepID=UPI0036A3949B